MSESRNLFTGSIPELYDRHLGPVMFEPYAADLAQRVAVQGSGPVLEAACGTGILTARLRAALAPEIRIVATDFSPPMLDYARRKLAGLRNVDWQQADLADLPFAPAAFGTLACQFGVMFVPDKAALFRAARRVLVDGGLLAFSVWDALAHTPHARVAHETIGGFFASDPPRFFELPFGFHDPAVLRRLLAEHDFAQVCIETVALEAQAESARTLAVGLVQGGPIAAEIEARGAALEPIVSALTAALAHLGGAAPFRSPMQALVITARAGAA